MAFLIKPYLGWRNKFGVWGLEQKQCKQYHQPFNCWVPTVTSKLIFMALHLSLQTYNLFGPKNWACSAVLSLILLYKNKFVWPLNNLKTRQKLSLVSAQLWSCAAQNTWTSMSPAEFLLFSPRVFYVHSTCYCHIPDETCRWIHTE